ncbi:universal stress protein [Salinigranum salinum]|uniref:universal stress protein n=1 Tax=Salinigranum salinum TaxID=1364937 RepID=UPI0012609300|nr:universal stress protein [Salinigranum salinum]
MRRAPSSLVDAPVHETIVEYAETNDVDLVVVGLTGRGWLSTLLRSRVVTSMDIPVYGQRLSRDSQSDADRSRSRGYHVAVTRIRAGSGRVFRAPFPTEKCAQLVGYC